MDSNLIKIVAEDLKFLREEWDEEISDASLRRSSNVLRNLLVYSQLQQVARHLGEEIYIDAPEIVDHREKLADPRMLLYQCGGATYKGGRIGVFVKYSTQLSAEEMCDLTAPSKKVRLGHQVKLGKYLRQPSFIVEGLKIDRETVIKYVANKLGGTHYSQERNNKKDEKYIKLDEIRRWGMELGGKEAVYFELLSIGQRVVNSQTVSRIYEIIKSMLNHVNSDNQ